MQDTIACWGLDTTAIQTVDIIHMGESIIKMSREPRTANMCLQVHTSIIGHPSDLVAVVNLLGAVPLAPLALEIQFALETSILSSVPRVPQ